MSPALQLERPLVAFDLETTGLDVKNDRIVEISCVKIFPDRRREIRTLRLNPGMPISQQASAVHGISDADVQNEAPFTEVAGDLAAFFTGADLSGFNLEDFDLPLLRQEFSRAGIDFPAAGTRVIDSRKIFMLKEPRTLSAAYQFYCKRSLEQAHSAEADAVAAADVLLAQVEHYDDIPNTLEALDAFCHPKKPNWLDQDGKIIWHDGHACLSFGKHKYRPLQEMVDAEPGYLRWMVGANFKDDVVAVIEKALAGEFPAAP